MRRSGIRIMAELIGLIAPLMHVMILAITSGVLGFLCAISITILGGYAILTYLGLDSLFTIKTIFITVLVLAASRGILHYIEQLSNHYIAFKLLALIRDKVFKALRKLSPAKLEGRDKGNLIALITSDIELLEVFYAHTISPIAIGILTSLIMTIFIGSFNIILGVIAFLGYFTIGFIIPYFSSKFGKNDGMTYRNNFGKLNSYFLDSLWGIKEILQFGYGDKRTKNIESKTDDLMDLNKKLKKYEGIISGLTTSAVSLFTLAILVVSLMISKELNFASIIIPTIAMASSFGPVIALSNLSNNLFMTLASGERVLNLLAEKPIVEEVYDGKKDVSFNGVECEDVYFDYEGENILNDYNLDIEPNKIIGISGKSGSGKSTLLKLFMRFWDIKKGNIKISNTDIKDINTDTLRDMESYVTQETSIFKDTIENNIKIANKDATHEEVVEACKKASLHDFIMSLPDGYNTNVGELGDTLSGGEKQRIGIARSFLHKAPFILLDEPTSNLDSLNEAVILKSIKDNSENRTVVLVSHRLSTLNIADKVYKMKTDRVS
ncbi:ABC transporter ATP-binding protein/permease [Brachyspira hyodysenteriae]|uniref:amino acid ABC transporter ATP-binding/permease protein n=1 Tax=Brachyspira hyodysenteriae TaxID=159 RepID=UPI0022CDA918|nr:ABC transporter ATP-binding protein [Brachyspira hyodysenteriae]MDA0035605.1 ABC transporter ATP-binding protein/permease [Brachyspira hyodysenteriae]MDA0049691.1 ABC transporter ATP-binding protein/permease [Brachyspira hyodysenteriae]MDA0063937.1 ABC transporter ATP-binding protein/permease [Brachyspira hyodysenteriae]MDA0067011.1 ABC transporter ATP-binding protein/permease [Brachyspira hyodysenteriae]MDA0072086.1 ABC transporter ATP-binding protein/permease [Brachyspira hyodysenteriae]